MTRATTSALPGYSSIATANAQRHLHRVYQNRLELQESVRREFDRIRASRSNALTPVMQPRAPTQNPQPRQITQRTSAPANVQPDPRVADLEEQNAFLEGRLLDQTMRFEETQNNTTSYFTDLVERTDNTRAQSVSNAGRYLLGHLNTKWKKRFAVALPLAALVGGIIGYQLCYNTHDTKVQTAPATQGPVVLPAPLPQIPSDPDAKDRLQRMMQGPANLQSDFVNQQIPPLAIIQYVTPPAPQPPKVQPRKSKPTVTQPQPPPVRAKPTVTPQLLYLNTINNGLPKDAQQALDMLVNEYQGVTRREVTIPKDASKPTASQDTLTQYQVSKDVTNTRKLHDLATVVDMLKPYMSSVTVQESEALKSLTQYTNPNDDFTLNAADAYKSMFQKNPLVIRKKNVDGSTTVSIVGYRADVHKHDKQAVK